MRVAESTFLSVGALLVLGLLAAGCGGPDFSTSGGGGSAGTGTGGSGGVASQCATCGQGEYCGADAKCHSCADTANLSFGPAEPLTKVNTNVGGDLGLPRIAGKTGTALAYTANDNTMQPPGRQIWLAPGPDSGPGVAVSSAGTSSSGPLYITFDFPLGTQPDLLFDRLETTGTQADGPRDLYGAKLGTTAIQAAGALPAPFNANGASDYSMAVAPSRHRAWWMTDRGGGQRQLMTFQWASGNGSAGVVDLTVQAPGRPCPRAGNDATPWVTPDGSVMLFSAIRMDQDCHPEDDKRDVFWVKLDTTTGRPAQGAVGQPLANIDHAGVDETDPSLSPDLCTLYFSSGDGHDNKLYRAPRL